MKQRCLWFLGFAMLMLQACTSDPPKVYPPAPLSAEYPAKLSWANLNTPIGVDRYSRLTPAVENDTIFLAERNGNVSALKLNNGKPLWTRETGFRFSAGVTLHDNVLYAGTSKAELIALNANDGNVVWTQALSSEVLVPAVVKGERIIVRSNDGKVYGLRTKDGKVIWVYDRNVPALSLRGNSVPVIVDTNVIIGFANGRLISLSLLDGKTNWETAIALPRGRTELERMVDIDGALVEEDGVVYVSSYNGKIAAVDAELGSIAWTRDISSHLGVTIKDDNVLLTDVSGKVWSLDKESGATLWMQDKLTERATTRPVVVQDKILIGDALGELYWLSVTDGRLLGHFPHDKPSKASGATWVIDELDDYRFETPRPEAKAVVYEPQQVNSHILVTYQNGILASISLVEN